MIGRASDSALPPKSHFGDAASTALREGVIPPLVEHTARLGFDWKRIEQVGAWAYGLQLISELLLPSVVGTCTPPFFVFGLDERPSNVVSKLRPLGTDWAMKYSCSGPVDFTHRMRRGDNAPIVRRIYLATHPEAFAQERLRRVCYHAPRHAQCLVLQKLVEYEAGYLFHADLAWDRTELEIDFRTGRTLFVGQGAEVLVEDSRRSGPTDTERADGLVMWERLRACLMVLTGAFECESWAIEGFWDAREGKLVLLQLRPTPLDRPAWREAESDGNAVFTSSFVWGGCTRDIEVRGGSILGERLLVNPDDGSDEYGREVLGMIAAGAVDLVVRTGERNASRLSHDPWFLPPPEYRNGFCHGWIPNVVLASCEGEMLRITSDGDRLRLFRAT